MLGDGDTAAASAASLGHEPIFARTGKTHGQAFLGSIRHRAGVLGNARHQPDHRAAAGMEHPSRRLSGHRGDEELRRRSAGRHPGPPPDPDLLRCRPGRPVKAVQMLKAGEIDVAEFNLGPLAEAVPPLQAFNLPFLFSSATHMFRYLDGPMGERLAEKAQGVRLRRAGLVQRRRPLVLLRRQAHHPPRGPGGAAHPRAAGRFAHRDGEAAGRHAGGRALQGSA